MTGPLVTPSGNHSAISRCALSTASLPWMMFLCACARARACGRVSPAARPGRQRRGPGRAPRGRAHPDFDAEVAADGARRGLGGVGGADDLPPGLDDVLALPHHGHHGRGDDVLHERAEERLAREVRVVVLRELLGHLHHLQPAEREALPREAVDDLPDEAALHAVRLDHDVRLLHPDARLAPLRPRAARRKPVSVRPPPPPFSLE